MAKHLSTVIPQPPTTLHSFEFTHEELKAIVNVIGKSTHLDINNNLWEGSQYKSTITKQQWFDLYNILSKKVR